ncbi:MBL fold metallo-hydrolase [Vibrio sp. JC009]|uniref:MBL fold metallo-hydrolase n=1 Tax=Vibrio sp. JC009 TaxID=2912314 RepID=UPI0023AE8445|nr:MBL fold metallo-hydrolase [Vibrio sp. JC009]WED23823.1 MBL fold metallo-hydrolase [Vibrio sp. JC009]
MVKQLTFRILVDNTSKEGLPTEHGFAVWVECDDKIILFDTGQNTEGNGILFSNAQAMGCDLTKVDYLVLSHGHYDHTGAVSQLLEVNTKLKVICHPQALMQRRYSIYPDKAPRQIAMPEKHRFAIEALAPERVVLWSDASGIFPGVGFSGSIPREHPLEDTGGPFYLDKDKVTPDLIEDDISLWFSTEKGLIILTGCCHSGLINTVQHICKAAGEPKIAGIIGGLHLNRASAQRLDSTISALADWMPEFVVPTHCTGEEAIMSLKDALGERVSDGGSGLVIPIPVISCSVIAQEKSLRARQNLQ